ARNFAFEWYADALLAKDAREQELFKRHPGLAAAAEATSRRMIARAYLDDALEREYAPTEDELRQAYDVRKDSVCAAPTRVHLSVAGVRWGRKASKEEIELAEKRLATIQERLADGDDF